MFVIFFVLLNIKFIFNLYSYIDRSLNFYFILFISLYLIFKNPFLASHNYAEVRFFIFQELEDRIRI